MASRLLRLIVLVLFLSLAGVVRCESDDLKVSVTPVVAGEQLVRASLPLPGGLVREGDALIAQDAAHSKVELAVRPLSWHPVKPGEPKSVRRAMVTFPYTFKTLAPVQLWLTSVKAKPKNSFRFPVEVECQREKIVVRYQHGPELELHLLAPARSTIDAQRREVVESNAFYRWERFHLADPQWPRMIEVRADALGEVVVEAHLQRNLPGDGRTPDFGWEVGEFPAEGAHLDSATQFGSPAPVPPTPTLSPGERESRRRSLHSFTNGTECSLSFAGGKYCIYHPTAALKRRGRSETHTTKEGGLVYRYGRCTADEKVPMQSTAWHRAELVIAPAKLAHLTATFQSPHQVASDVRLWDALYATSQPLDLKARPELDALLKYHREAIVRSMAVGDDLGNVTAYTDGRLTGEVFGMNRLNHCPAIFQEAWRSGDRRLLETALLWCDNFYDQTIWWGEKQYGGTRYNNIIAQRRTPPDEDHTYMWRSNDSVNFCTKGYDSFWLAYEETGNPRMLQALEAQVAYARENVHADKGECRNIGDVREFIRLYEYTGRTDYLNEALRLFRELRTKLSTGDLFDQGGKPLAAELPFIDDDEAGLHIGYAKPYIIGYALAGLPELAPLAPSEPKLRDVVTAVADFLAESQDPLGGWRYPQPRSSYLILSQAIEHAWQLVQSDRLLGPQEKHLDAIERVLRQRLHGWQRTGKIFAGLNGWEITTGRIKERSELKQLYKKTEERDFKRDYSEGEPGFGSCPPEGLVYFPEVLAFYLQHRPASRLLAPPNPDEPLGKVLARVKKE
jgi:hypothetical protein